MINRLHYKSEEDFVRAFSEFHSNIATDSKKSRRTHPYIVQFPENCNHHCHTLLSNKFSHHRYEVLDSRHVLVSASHTALKDLQKANPDKILDFAVFHPEMKICDNVRQWQSLSSTAAQSVNVDLAGVSRFASQFHNLVSYSKPVGLETAELSKSQSCLYERFNTRRSRANRHGIAIDKSPQFTMSVRLHFLEKDSSEWMSFSRFLERLQTSTTGVRVAPFSLPDQPSMMYLNVEVRDCSRVYDIANAFASRPEVVWVERAFSIELHNRWSKGLCDTGTTEVEALNYHNFTGLGEVVGVADTGLDLKNCYFYDPDAPAFSYQSSSVSASGTPVLNPYHRKVVQYIAFNDRYDDSEDAHGTHVAGTVAGYSYKNYGDFKKFNGMSTEAKIAFFDLGDATEKLITPGNINTDLFQKLYRGGARVFTNSWGTASSNEYDDKAVQVDTFMWNYPQAIVFFSAGNTGASGYNTVSSPSTNKNGVSVGASSNSADSWKGTTQDGTAADGVNENAVAYFSSRGPTKDARQKPEILAPGFYVYSARGYYNSSAYFCATHGLSGTSMAAPTAAGMAVKVRQYFKAGYYPSGFANAADSFVPSGALIKAILVHSAQEMSHMVYSATNATTLNKGYPSKEQGYGRIQLNKVLNFGAVSQPTNSPLSLYVIGSTDSSDASLYSAFTATGTKTFTFTTADTVTGKVRVTFSYTDYPGSSASSNPLTNKLYMTVKTGTTTFSSLIQSGIDWDNTQVVDIGSPSPSTTYTITITASTLAQTPQPIALVVTGAISYNLTTTATGDEPYDYQTSSTYISAGARKYIGILAALTLIFIVLAWYFRRITAQKKAVVIDPTKFTGNGDGYDPSVEQEGGKKSGSLFSSVFKGRDEKGSRKKTRTHNTA